MIRNRIAYNPNTEYRLHLSRAEGSSVWDERGRRYIDFTSGWNVTNLGWNHPEVAEAMIEQVRRNSFAPLWGADPVQELYAEMLTAALPAPLDTCIKATSGTEAVECAIKVARAATGRTRIVGFRESYHGQLFASMALGFTPDLASAIAPLVPQFTQIDFPRDTGEAGVLPGFVQMLDALLCRRDVAAIVLEPGLITGWGTVHVAPPGFMAAVRECTRKYGTLLIADEVGTGFSRTGKLFALEHEAVVPDLVCLAKAISNGGAGIGAVVGSADLIGDACPYTNLTSTFGWAPVACAAALKTLEIHQRDNTAELAQRKGQYLMEQLKARTRGCSRVAEVRGRGMELAIEFKGEPGVVAKVSNAASAEGVHLAGGWANVLQLMPPLTITRAELDEGIDVLASAVSAYAS